MKPSYAVSRLLMRLLDAAALIVPLQTLVRRRRIAAASGLKREELLAALAWWQGDGPAAIEHWRVLEAAQPQRAVWPLKIAQAIKERGDFDEAEGVLHAARARGIAGESLELDLLRYARMSRRSNSAVEDAQAIVADPAASDDKVFFAAYHLITQNKLEAARAGLERVAGGAKYGPLARGNLAGIEKLAAAKAAGRPEMPGRVSPALTSFLVREPESDTLVVGFALGEGTLGQPLNVAHAMLSSKGVNGLYLYDSRHVYHLTGTDRFGAGYDAMLAGIRALAAELGTKKLYTMGGSATGYTAIRAGMDLEADGAIVFSAPTLMLRMGRAELARGAYTLQRLKQQAWAMMADLRPIMLARKKPLRVEMYYSASNRRDLMHAGNLTGVPGVRLIPIAGLERHDSLTEMVHLGHGDLLDGFKRA